MSSLCTEASFVPKLSNATENDYTHLTSFTVVLHSLHLVIRFTFATRTPPTHTGALQCVVIYGVRYSIRQLANVDTQVCLIHQ